MQTMIENLAEPISLATLDNEAGTKTLLPLINSLGAFVPARFKRERKLRSVVAEIVGTHPQLDFNYRAVPHVITPVLDIEGAEVIVYAVEEGHLYEVYSYTGIWRQEKYYCTIADSKLQRVTRQQAHDRAVELQAQNNPPAEPVVNVE